MLCSPRLQRTAALTTAGGPSPTPAPYQGLPALGRVGRYRLQQSTATPDQRSWQMGFLHPAEFPNCHIMSALCNSGSYRFSTQTRQVTVPLHAEIPSGCLGTRDLPQTQADSLPGQLGSAQGSREGQRGGRARGTCTSLACHCVSAVCRSHGGHGERRVRHHDARRDLLPRCPAAAADTEVGRGAGKASPMLVTARAFPVGAKEQHQPVSSLLPPSQKERISKAIFKVSLA